MSPNVNLKTKLDKISEIALLMVTLISSSVIVIVVGFIFAKGLRPFTNNYLIDDSYYNVNFFTFISGLNWFKYPNDYGIGYAIINTLYIVLLTILISGPISILTALFISRIANKKLATILKYLTELLASIPSIIFGVFGKGFITKITMSLANIFNIQTAGGLGTLSSVLVLSMMIMPTITLISITAIDAVPDTYVKASLGLGATKTQTNFKVVLRSASSGIFSGIILGVGRALGEATAISMVCGNSGSNPTFSFFDTTSTLTTVMMAGLSETTGLDYDIRFSVGIILIVIILLTNIVLNIIKKKVSY